MFRYLLAIFVALAMVFVEADAQRNNGMTFGKRKKVPFILQGFSVDAKIGPSIFFGDIQDGGRFSVGGGVAAHKAVIKPLNVRVDLEGGFLSGDADWGGSFKTTYFDITAGVDYLFLNQILGYNAGRGFDPYVSAGFGVLLFKPNNPFINGLDGSIGGSLAELGKDNPFSNADAFTSTPMWYGLGGFRIRINKNWSGMCEIKGVMPIGSNSDMLDGQDSRNMTSDAIYLGKKKYDAFYSVMVGATYKFADMEWKVSSKYNRKMYMQNRKVYKRNAKRSRRR
ncbi:MAG: hypothetical protein MJZ15_11435 [Bacteroidales bacterium]|nr:hypothetical protein [Bacteroidales bacterium]